MRGKLLVAAAVFLLSAAPASAELKFAETVTDTGDPGLTAAVWPADGSTIEWRRCADGGTACEPLADGEYVRTISNGRVALPGGTPAGTVFEAVATKDGVETKARTRAWQGRVASATPPSLQGEAAVGKSVTVVPGTWSGGWQPGPGSTYLIYACREPAGVDCWLISYDASVVPESRWAGWYLFAQEYFTTGSATCNAILSCSISDARIAPPYPLPHALERSTTFELSAAFGPIAGPEPVRLPECLCAPAPKPKATTPTASIRARALRSKGQLLVGRVRCEVRCSVQLKVAGGHRRAVYSTFSVTGAKALIVPVRHGKLTVRVIVNGKLLASGATLAR